MLLRLVLVGMFREAIIIDDIVDTGGSLVGGIKMLYDRGAKDVYCACTHGILSGPRFSIPIFVSLL